MNNLPGEMAARAICRDAIRGYPDTVSARAKAQVYVEARWQGVWMWMRMTARWKAIFDV